MAKLTPEQTIVLAGAITKPSGRLTDLVDATTLPIETVRAAFGKDSPLSHLVDTAIGPPDNTEYFALRGQNQAIAQRCLVENIGQMDVPGATRKDAAAAFANREVRQTIRSHLRTASRTTNMATKLSALAQADHGFAAEEQRLSPYMELGHKLPKPALVEIDALIRWRTKRFGDVPFAQPDATPGGTRL
ncbi:MAG: hypothetical protein KI792_04350 [Alphaproteobacteria bacterium]|nr:hypothetical protein [Alphaproteobacteria bacterium SS10]